MSAKYCRKFELSILTILNLYIEKYRYIEIFDTEVDDTIRYIDIETIYR